MIDKLRYWLICLLAGKRMIVLNCEVKGSIHSKSGQGGLVRNNHFTGEGKVEGIGWEPKTEVNAALERIVRRERG